MAIELRVAGTLLDLPAVLDGARAFAATVQAADVLPPLDSAEFDGAVTRLVTMRGVTVILAEQDGEVVGGLGVLVSPYLWNPSKMSLEELFWWVRPGASPHAAGMLFRDARRRFKAAGGGIISFGKLVTSPDGVDRVYRKAGMRPIQTVYIGVL